MVVRELLCRLGFETDEKKVNSFEKSIGTLKEGLKDLVVAATAVKAAALGIVYSTAAYSDEITRSAKLANTSIQEFQELAVASQTVGIEQDKLADILKDVNDKMGDYAQTGGGAMADFFEFIAPKIGVTAEQFRNLSGADALQLYVSSLEKANLSQADMTFYMEAIASDSTLLLPLLEKNGEAYKALAKEAEEYGAILSEETIEQNKKFTKELKSLDNMVDGVRRTIGNQLIPVFNEIIRDFKEFIGKNRELIQIRIKSFFEGAISVIKTFINVLGTVYGWTEKVAKALGGWENTLKLLGVAIGVVMSLKFIGYLWSLYKALKAVGWIVALGTALGLGMIAAVVALSVAIVLLIEDIYQWVSGNESAIGDLLGSWEDFKNKFMGYITKAVDYVKNKFNEVSEAISNAFNSAIESVKNYFVSLYNDVVNIVDKIVSVFTGLKDKVAKAYENAKNSFIEGSKSLIPDISLNPFSSNPTPTTQSVLGANGNSLSSVVNDNKTINITVPPGTTAEQVEAVKQQINKTMQQQYTDAAQHLEGY